MSILTKHEAADVPHVPDDRLGLDQLLDDRPDDDQQVVCADHHIPDEDGDDLLSHTLGDEKLSKKYFWKRIAQYAQYVQYAVHNMHNMHLPKVEELQTLIDGEVPSIGSV